MARLLGTTLFSPFRCTLALLLLFLCTTVHAAQLMRIVDENQSFITRPDIFIPKWNITVHDQESLSPGYWFVSPYEHDPKALTTPGDWTAPMIFDQNGDLVWSGAALTKGYKTFDFRVSNVLGEDKLTFLNPRNRSFVVLDNHYDISTEVEITVENSTEIDNVRELNFVNNGTRALVFFDQTRNATKPISAEIGFNGTCLLYDSTFREADSKQDWKWVYRWAAHKRIDLSESVMTEGTVDQRCNETVDGWDWVQTNSVDRFNENGRYLISAQYTNTIYKLYRSGDVEWRLGGNRSDFEADFSFSNQQHVRIMSHNDTHTVISFLDNADPAKGAGESSRGLLVSLRTDAEPKTATLLGEYRHPDGPGSYIPDAGSMQVLPDGNVFSGWVEKLQISEHAANGKLLMEAHAEQDWLKSYRSYKFPFVGRPTNPPDVHAEARREGAVKTTVYASWNGATEVAGWNVYNADRNGKPATKRPVAYAQRSGFETKIDVDEFTAYVVVDAVDKDGVALGRSNVFRTVATVSQPGEAQQDEPQQVDEVGDTPDAAPDNVSEDEKSWKETAKETATSKSGIGGFIGFLVAVAIIIIGIRFWRIRRRRNVRTIKTKHNRKDSNNVLGTYRAVPEVEYVDDDGYESGKG